MLISESIEKTKNFFRKSLVNLKSLLFGGYKKLPKPALLNPFSCSIGIKKNHHKDLYYTEFCNAWESDLDGAKKRRKNKVTESRTPVNEENGSSGSFMKLADEGPVKNKQEERKKEEKKMVSFRMDKNVDQCSQGMTPEGYALAQKMKQLDMMDAGDMEHVLDVEEALHYYSRLRSPVYLDIVDKFFTDMYSELNVPQASASINTSKRRLGSIRL